MKGIAFGQYYPAKSVMHRLDPRFKIVIGILYIVASFLCKNDKQKIQAVNSKSDQVPQKAGRLNEI